MARRPIVSVGGQTSASRAGPRPGICLGLPKTAAHRNLPKAGNHQVRRCRDCPLRPCAQGPGNRRRSNDLHPVRRYCDGAPSACSRQGELVRVEGGGNLFRSGFRRQRQPSGSLDLPQPDVSLWATERTLLLLSGPDRRVLPGRRVGVGSTRGLLRRLGNRRRRRSHQRRARNSRLVV